jgi:ribonucleoside-diphosphate reductase alpha chain
VTIGPERFSLTASQRDDGSLCEVFIGWGKHGTSSAGLMATYAVALSTGLQHRVPLADLIRPGLDQYFLPNGHTDDPEIPRVRSAVDYVARRLAIDWLPYPERAALGVYTLTERVRRWELAAGLRAPGLAAARSRRGVTGRPGGAGSSGRPWSLPGRLPWLPRRPP